jgi:hypothetical protein
MPVRLVPQEELPPPLNGYRLLERLGRGGFGEVWKVEAPGGLPKAAKFVFGDLDAVDDDESRPAEQEFKALNRVKLIRHPYILSLERFEAIEGQLIIIMELADRNLWDRFRECRGQGLVGVPREELLRYLEETAEAIDLMNGPPNNIQHLDIKPQNIFLVGTHVKVADFGLAKMFEGAKATVTGGVTPVYAAPETFEGWISRFSDQYSLAIVFQEMLTGTRPFNGANTKQLLMQHLNGTPDLTALTVADREVVGRGLRKKPEDRWPSCTELVNALRAAGTVKRSTGGIPFPATRPTPGVKADTPRPAGANPPAVPLGGSGAVAAPAVARSPGGVIGELSPPGSRLITPGMGLSGAPRLVTVQGSNGSALLKPAQTLPRPAVVQTGRMSELGLAPPERTGDGTLFPALVVAAGGTGLGVIRELRQMIRNRFGALAAVPTVRFLYIDTDPDAAAAATQGPDALAPAEVLLARLNRPAHYLQATGLPSAESWLPAGQLYRLPKQSAAANGVRAFGRLALLDNYQPAVRRVRQEIEQLMADDPLDKAAVNTRLGLRTNRPRVYVVAGLAGGTGSGMAIDLGYLLRHELRAVGYRNPETVGMLLVPPADPNGRPDWLANSYAALTELRHFTGGGQYSVQFDPAGPPVTGAGGPFTRTAFVTLPAKPKPKYQQPVYGLAARGLFSELLTPAGRTLDFVRSAVPPAGPPEPAGQVFGLYRLSWPRAELLSAAARQFARRLLTQWASKESAHLREPIDRWLTDEWAAKKLDPQAVVARLMGAARDALRENPEAVFAAAAETLRPGSGGGRVDPHAAAAVFDQLLKLVGKPSAENDPPTGLEVAVQAAAKAVAGEAEAALSEITVKFIERPQYRLAGADEALNQVLARLTQAVEALEPEVDELRRQATEAYARLFHTIGSLGGALSGIVGRKPGYLNDVLEPFRVFPALKLRLSVAAAALALYRVLLGNVPEYIRDVTHCRARLGELADQAAAGADAAPDPGPGALILPDGCDTLAAAVDQFLAGLSPEDILGFDQSLQQEVHRRFRGLTSVCQKPARDAEFLALLAAQTRTFLEGRQEAVDPAAALFKYHGPGAATLLREGYEKAAPDPGGATEAAVLAAPPGPAGDELRTVAAAACPGVEFIPAPLPDDILIYRECPRVPLAALPQLGDLARAAYEAQLGTDQPPHARVDVQWS